MYINTYEYVSYYITYYLLPVDCLLIACAHDMKQAHAMGRLMGAMSPRARLRAAWARPGSRAATHKASVPR